MNQIRYIEQLNETELKNGIPFTASWHQEYASSSSIFIGNLPMEFTEGDIIQIFSQYGEIVDLQLVRDRETGKSKGFGFLWYENQKSTVLAVDNFNGIKLTDRLIRVNHHMETREKHKGKHRDESDREFIERVEERRNKVAPSHLLESFGKDDERSKESKRSKKARREEREEGDETEDKQRRIQEEKDREDPMAKYIKKKKRRH